MGRGTFEATNLISLRGHRPSSADQEPWTDGYLRAKCDVS